MKAKIDFHPALTVKQVQQFLGRYRRLRWISQ
jgi:hypothetical protein